MSLLAAKSKEILALADNLRFAEINIEQKKIHQERLKIQESISSNIADMLVLEILSNIQDELEYITLAAGAFSQLIEIAFNTDIKSLPIVSAILTSISTTIILLKDIGIQKNLEKIYYLELLNNIRAQIARSSNDSKLADSHKKMISDRLSEAVVEYQNSYSEGILR